MTLYSSGSDPFCHRVKIILAEKDINADIIDIDVEDKMEELYELNPYGKVPTLMTKDLIAYETDIVFEYLEERFPYPPLLSVFPLERAYARMLGKKIDEVWMPLLISALNSNNESEKHAHKTELLKVLFGLIPTLRRQPYLLGDDFSIIDCSFAVILYNLPRLDIRLPESAQVLVDYAKRLFARPSFRQSIKM